MELGDFFEVLVALGVIMVGLLGGKKKKPAARQASLPGPRPIVVRAPVRASAEPSSVDRILQVLEGRIEEARGGGLIAESRTPTVVSLEEDLPEEAASAQPTEAAGEASHERFHDLYLRPLAEVRGVDVFATLPTGGLRTAIVWSEILGPPKGLER